MRSVLLAFVLMAGCAAPDGVGPSTTARTCGPTESPTTGTDSCCPSGSRPSSMGCVGWPAELELGLRGDGPFDAWIPLPDEPWCLPPDAWAGLAGVADVNATHLRVSWTGEWTGAPGLDGRDLCRPIEPNATRWPANASVLVVAGAGTATARLHFTADYHGCTHRAEVRLEVRTEQRLETVDECFVI